MHFPFHPFISHYFTLILIYEFYCDGWGNRKKWILQNKHKETHVNRFSYTCSGLSLSTFFRIIINSLAHFYLHLRVVYDLNWHGNSFMFICVLSIFTIYFYHRLPVWATDSHYSFNFFFFMYGKTWIRNRNFSYKCCIEGVRYIWSWSTRKRTDSIIKSKDLRTLLFDKYSENMC